MISAAMCFILIVLSDPHCPEPMRPLQVAPAFAVQVLSQTGGNRLVDPMVLEIEMETLQVLQTSPYFFWSIQFEVDAILHKPQKGNI